MAKKKTAQAPSGAKKVSSSKKAKTRKKKLSPRKTAAKKKVAKAIGKPAGKKPATGRGKTPAKKVKAKKTMTSDLTSEKDTATGLEELLPADSSNGDAGHESKDRRKKKTKVKFKSVMLREEAISYFEAIVAGLKRGSIQIRQGDDSLLLKPTPQLDVAVKATSRDQEERIEFEIGWTTASESELTISTD